MAAPFPGFALFDFYIRRLKCILMSRACVIASVRVEKSLKLSAEQERNTRMVQNKDSAFPTFSCLLFNSRILS